MTSSTGLWTLRTSPVSTNQWSSVCYGNGLFVAGVVQLDVDLALNTVGYVPVGFAVADEADAGGHVGESFKLMDIGYIGLYRPARTNPP